MTDSPTPAPVPLSALLERRVRKESAVHFEVTPDWMQGRAAFGGLVAALSLQAMRDVEGEEWPLRALQTSFVGPVGGDTSVEVRLLRKGRNMKQVQATVQSGGQVAAVLLAAFGNSRPTVVPERRPKAPPVALALDALVEVPFMPGFSPSFLQHLQSRWAEGEFPVSGRESWHSRIYTRLLDTAVDLELTTVMLTDMPPTPVLSFFEKRAPASSVSWELELMPRRDSVDRAGWFRVDTEAVTAAEGYVSQRTTLFDPEGDVAALGYQLVGIYG